MIIAKKNFKVGNERVRCELRKEGDLFIVNQNGVEYKRTYNEAYATQVFNSL